MWKNTTRRFLRESQGGVAILFGFVIPILIGFAGLAVDASVWMLERNRLQAASDGAAIAVAQTLQLDGKNGPLNATANKQFSKMYGNAQPAVTFRVESPPATGANAGNANAAAVFADRNQPVYFSALFGLRNVVTKTRSVALVDSFADACLLALSPDEDKAVEVTGNATINLGCGVASNSDSPESVYLSGSSELYTSGVSAVGDILKKNNAKVETNGGPMVSHAPVMNDPYGPKGRNLQVPTFPTACTANNLKVKKNTTLSPGRYCGGIDFQGGDVTLQPGVYIMDAGSFKANGNGSISGTDVTIILTGSGSNYGQIDINGNTNINLHAPKTGSAYNGVLVFQDPNAPYDRDGPNYMNGNANMVLSGAVYIPSQELRFSGSTNSNVSCLQLIAHNIKLTGNAKITNKCDANSGTENIRRVSIKLVE